VRFAGRIANLLKRRRSSAKQALNVLSKRTEWRSTRMFSDAAAGLELLSTLDLGHTAAAQ
jgi:hypothetical protein